MNSLLSKTGYHLDPVTQVWARADYSGIVYNDGDEAENRIASIISEATDLSVLSNELTKHCLDWASTYHLSTKRANILRPFKQILLNADVLEIGSGCGAITRYIGECGANVLALEGAPRRAGITRSRSRDLPNVTVVTEQFHLLDLDKKFDVITLIGVLEYANLFMPGDCPVLAMLQRIKSMLKPNGKLIIAIENQLGLKYFAGAPEDHLGIAMYGIEGRYQNSQPQTYGRKTLINYLKQAGFADSHVFAPFPDYKLPVSIITEHGFTHETFDAGTIISQSVRQDPQLPPNLTFSPELVWSNLVKNDLARDLSNSFLIVAQMQEEPLMASQPLAYHYSTQRASIYCKETVFALKDDDIKVSCNLLSSAAYEKNSHDTLQHSIEQETKYIVGKPLSTELIEIVTREGWLIEELGVFIRRYISIISSLVCTNDRNIQIDSIDTLLPGESIDLIPQNIMMGKDNLPYTIDKEWTCNTEISIGFMVYRSMLLLDHSLSRFGTPGNIFFNNWKELLIATYNAAGFEVSDHQLQAYLELENNLQNDVQQRGINSIDIFSLNNPVKGISIMEDNNVSEIRNLHQTIAEFSASTSWRLTKPLRLLARLITNNPN